MRFGAAFKAVAGVSSLALALGLAAQPAAAAGEVVLEKSVNGDPADQGPGPTVTSGTVVNFIYTVTVNSAEPLYDVRVSDTSNVTPSCDINGDGIPDGFDFHPGPLQNGASFVCRASETAGDPGLTYASLGKVRAIDFLGTKTFEHQDPAHYTTVAPPTTAPPTTAAPTTKPPTTQAPTTAAPTTAAPTTEAPTTQAPTTAVPTTAAPTTEAPISAAESINQTTASNPTSDPKRSQTTGSATTADPTTSETDSAAPGEEDGDGPDDPPPGELEFDDGDDPQRGLSPWLLLLTFAGGAGVAFLATRFGPGRDSAPGQ